MAERFEQTVMPHLDAAYNLARWLTRSRADADDVVQEAYLRAMRFFDGFRGGDSRAWILKIVRNTCYSRARKSGGEGSREAFDETVHSPEEDRSDAEARLVADEEGKRVRRALEALPAAYREVLVMREIEGLSYKEIAEVMGVPMGTVMSTVSRARQKMREQLAEPARKET